MLKVRTVNCLSDITPPNDCKIGTAVITQMIIWTLHKTRPVAVHLKKVAAFVVMYAASACKNAERWSMYNEAVGLLCANWHTTKLCTASIKCIIPPCPINYSDFWVTFISAFSFSTCKCLYRLCYTAEIPLHPSDERVNAAKTSILPWNNLP
jgi:hypothetical protein